MGYDRIRAEHERFLHVLAEDRGCFVEDLSSLIVEAARGLALECYKIGAIDAGVSRPKTHSSRPTAAAPSPKDERPTVPPPGRRRR